IKQLLNDDIGLGWRERFDAEQNARKNRLKAHSPREGFKAFLERKGMRSRVPQHNGVVSHPRFALPQVCHFNSSIVCQKIFLEVPLTLCFLLEYISARSFDFSRLSQEFHSWLSALKKTN